LQSARLLPSVESVIVDVSSLLSVEVSLLESPQSEEPSPELSVDVFSDESPDESVALLLAVDVAAVPSPLPFVPDFLALAAFCVHAMAHSARAEAKTGWEMRMKISLGCGGRPVKLVASLHSARPYEHQVNPAPVNAPFRTACR
jgi:hypothetical protein